MSYSTLTPEELLRAFMFEDTAVSQVIGQTAGQTLAGIAELVALIFEEMYTNLRRRKMSKKNIIAASMVTRLWRDAGVPIIFRRQIIGNRRQLKKWVSLSEVSGGKFWNLCDALVWNGREARWRRTGEDNVWFDSKEVKDLMASADFSRVLQLDVFGATNLGNVIHVGEMVRRMARLTWMGFMGSHTDLPMQKAIVHQVAPSVTMIHGGPWCARDFRDYGIASTIEVRGDFIRPIVHHRIVYSTAIKNLTIHLSSLKEVRELEWYLNRFTNMERLTRKS